MHCGGSHPASAFLNCGDVDHAREATGLRGPFDHIVLVALLACLLSRKVSLPQRSWTSRTFAVHGNAVPRSQLLSTTVIYMPRLITPSLSSKSLSGDPGVSRSLSSQIEPPLATVDASSISPFNSVVNSCELSSHGADASETPERHLSDT